MPHATWYDRKQAAGERMTLFWVSPFSSSCCCEAQAVLASLGQALVLGRAHRCLCRAPAQRVPAVLKWRGKPTGTGWRWEPCATRSGLMSVPCAGAVLALAFVAVVMNANVRHCKSFCCHCWISITLRGTVLYCIPAVQK